ncbi:MAG TPA: hypothetical protein PKN86_10975, partial [Candidatus Obscuribacter sp.]|nr:hypothetical protein [Candidatus Obscuribacter sp.]
MNSFKKKSANKAMALSLGLGAVGVAMIVVSMTGFDVSVAQLKARGLGEIQRSELGKAEKTLKEALSRQELAKQESSETAEILLSLGRLANDQGRAEDGGGGLRCLGILRGARRDGRHRGARAPAATLAPAAAARGALSRRA